MIPDLSYFAYGAATNKAMSATAMMIVVASMVMGLR